MTEVPDVTDNGGMTGGVKEQNLQNLHGKSFTKRLHLVCDMEQL